MKLRRRYPGTISGLLFLLLAPGTASDARSDPATPHPVGRTVTAKAADGSAVVEKKTVILERIDGAKASISFPVVSTAGDKEVLKHVQEAVGLKAGTGMSLDEWKEDLKESSWLEEIDYEVSYDKDFILSLTTP